MNGTLFIALVLYCQGISIKQGPIQDCTRKLLECIATAGAYKSSTLELQASQMLGVCIEGKAK
jgi:hypothetical protein